MQWNRKDEVEFMQVMEYFFLFLGGGGRGSGGGGGGGHAVQ